MTGFSKKGNTGYGLNEAERNEPEELDSSEKYIPCKGLENESGGRSEGGLILGMMPLKCRIPKKESVGLIPLNAYAFSSEKVMVGVLRQEQRSLSS